MSFDDSIPDEESLGSLVQNVRKRNTLSQRAGVRGPPEVRGVVKLGTNSCDHVPWTQLEPWKRCSKDGKVGKSLPATAQDYSRRWPMRDTCITLNITFPSTTPFTTLSSPHFHSLHGYTRH